MRSDRHSNGNPVGGFLQSDVAPADTYRAGCMAQSPQSRLDLGSVPLDDKRVVKTFIVEDSPIILDNLVATLEEMAPVEVVGSAADEATALAKLSRLDQPVDLIIIDVFLRSGSGLGVLRGISNSARGAKRVVLTNYATPDMRDKCRSLGADRVFDKSNDLDDLIAYCTRLLEDGDDRVPAPLSS